MNDESLDQIERQIAAAGTEGSPRELRGKVLADVERELRAARWDRRLARAAVWLFVMGVGMNAALGLRSDGSAGRRLLEPRVAPSRSTLVETAIVVAEATDAVTARRFARQMAALSGRDLTAAEAAAIDAAVRRQERG